MKKSLVTVSMLCATTCFAQATLPASTQASDLPAYPRIRYEPGAIGLSLFYENDGGYVSLMNQTDCWYTAGIGAAVQWQSESTSQLVSDIPSIGGEFDYDRPQTSYAAGVVYSMNIFTPVDLRDSKPIYDDRPYAGWAYVGFLVQRAQRDAGTPAFESMELDLGTLGPASRAGSLQKWIHENFDSGDYPEGWGYQVDNEFGADFKYQRRWRFELLEPRADTFGADLIPDASFTAGTVHINATAGAMFRAGWQLPDDFGPAKMQSLGDFTRPFGRADGAQGISAYFYVRPAINVVAHDATFGNSFFQDNMISQDTDPVVVQGTFGVCLLFLKHCQFSYSQTFVSPEFTDQDRWHSYASLNFSFVTAW